MIAEDECDYYGGVDDGDNKWMMIVFWMKMMTMLVVKAMMAESENDDVGVCFEGR